MNGAAAELAGRGPGDARAEPITRLPGLAPAHGPGRSRRDHRARHARQRRGRRQRRRPDGRRPGSAAVGHIRSRRRRRHHRARSTLRLAGPSARRPSARETSTCSWSTPVSWSGEAQTDEQLRVVVTGAIQLVAVQERAAAAGISPDDLLAMVAPVPVDNVELGSVAGRSPDDETAAFVMTVLLFIAISHVRGDGAVRRGGGEVEPGRRGAAGPHSGPQPAGRQDRRHRPARARPVRRDRAGRARRHLDRRLRSTSRPLAGAVLAWVVVWFVLGYALYATVFGALGALVSRTEDAQSVAGPVSVVLIAGYFVSFAAIGSPDAVWARAVSFFPVTAPLAMPNRIAMGATAWWEPVVAVVLTLAAIAALVHLGGRVYAGAVLHTGPTLALREAWRDSTTPDPTAAESRGRPTGDSLRRARVVTGRRHRSRGPARRQTE